MKTFYCNYHRGDVPLHCKSPTKTKPPYICKDCVEKVAAARKKSLTGTMPQARPLTEKQKASRVRHFSKL